ncbi:MAG TPA: branched-chain amino acid ABC transporter permease [Thermoanaerobaculia bacterium]|jgi:branched-chain amino acid transport system permease protein|nr:branched-chain amino acid ABC transporter permease [Thermoanaerobaculia bacterium]
MLAQALLSGLIMGGIYALVSIGLTLIFGVLKIVNFAHGDFVMLGMFLAYSCFRQWGLHPFNSALIAFPVFFVVGFLIERGLIEKTHRREQDIQIILTLGIAAVIQGLCTFLFTPAFRTVTVTGLAEVVSIGSLVISKAKLFGFLAAVLFTCLFVAILKFTSLGRAVRASADNPVGALLVGIDLPFVRSTAFALGIATVGMAGALVMPFLNVSPEVGALFTLRAFVIVVLGGMGSIQGTLAASLCIGLLESMGAALLSDSLKQLPIFFVFVVALYLRGSGDIDPEIKSYQPSALDLRR